MDVDEICFTIMRERNGLRIIHYNGFLLRDFLLERV